MNQRFLSWVLFVMASLQSSELGKRKSLTHRHVQHQLSLPPMEKQLDKQFDTIDNPLKILDNPTNLANNIGSGYNELDQESQGHSHTNQNSSINNISRVDQVTRKLNESIVFVKNSLASIGQSLAWGYNYLVSAWNRWTSSTIDDGQTQYSDHDIIQINHQIQNRGPLQFTKTMVYEYQSERNRVPSMVQGIDDLLVTLGGNKNTTWDRDQGTMGNPSKKTNQAIAKLLDEPSIAPEITVLINTLDEGVREHQGQVLMEDKYIIKGTKEIFIDDQDESHQGSKKSSTHWTQSHHPSSMKKARDLDHGGYHQSHKEEPINTAAPSMMKFKKQILIEEQSYDDMKDQSFKIDFHLNHMDEESKHQSDDEHYFSHKNNLFNKNKNIIEPMEDHKSSSDNDDDVEPHMSLENPYKKYNNCDTSYQPQSTGKTFVSQGHSTIHDGSTSNIHNQTISQNISAPNNKTQTSKTSKESSQPSFLKIEQSNL